METNPTYFIELLHRYFAGEANPDEITELSGWVAKGPANLKEFEEIARMYQIFDKTAIEKKTNLNTEWEKLQAKVSPSQQVIYTQKHDIEVKKLLWLRIVLMAAIFIFIAVAGLFVFNLFTKVETRIITASGAPVNSTLPDGTKVTLNSGTTLSFPSKFKDPKREVKLDGMAYFEVTHNELQPFFVNTENISIEVLGTSFYVNTKAAGNNVNVRVKEGIVAVYYTSRPQNVIVLNAGDSISVSKTEKSLMVPDNNIPSGAGKIVFDDQPLSQIVFQLNIIYNVHIKLASEDIANCRMTTTFENQSLDAVLNVISETLNLLVTKDGDTIIISGEGCL